MIITATQVLEMLEKATRLRIDYAVYPDENEGHFIQFEVDWYADEHCGFSYEKVFINSQNELARLPYHHHHGNTYGWEFNAFMSMLDKSLKAEEEEKIKQVKRKELIDSLTPEQRELLNL
jgi:sterol desaturase/sphingolipid hydroxylase (fatty acid hydroxylase superfamily)